MIRMKNRKGITPVIAIVLLLMVTVGAVGVVYTQFQSLVGDPAEAVGSQQEVRNTEMSFSTVYKNTDTSTDSLNVTIKNTGDVAWNTSDFTMQFIPGGTGSAVSWTVAEQQFSGDDTEFDCFSEASSSQVIQPGDSYTCDTGFDFPGSTETIGIEVAMNDADKSWSYTCSPSTSDSYGC